MRRKTIKLKIQGFETSYGEIDGPYGKPLTIDVKLFPDQLEHLLDLINEAGEITLKIEK